MRREALCAAYRNEGGTRARVGPAGETAHSQPVCSGSLAAPWLPLRPAYRSAVRPTPCCFLAATVGEALPPCLSFATNGSLPCHSEVASMQRCKHQANVVHGSSKSARRDSPKPYSGCLPTALSFVVHCVEAIKKEHISC